MSNEPSLSARLRPLILTPLLASLILIVVLAFLVFRHFLIDFAVAGSVALILGPIQRRLTALLRGRSAIAAALLVLLVTAVILVPIVLSATLIGKQAVAFYEWLGPKLQPDAFHRWLQDLLTVRYPLLGQWLRLDSERLSQLASDSLSNLAGGGNRLIQGLVAKLTSALFELVLFVMLLFFMLRDGGRLRAELSRISPLPDHREDELLNHVSKTVKGVLLAMIVVPVAQGILAFGAFLAFGVPSPFLWSVMVVLAALIPLVGSPLGWMPAVGYLFYNGATWQWVGMLLFGLLVISTSDNLIKPLVLRDTAQIHPMLGFLAIVGGILTFGPMGFLIGPVVLSLVLSAVRIYRLDVLRAPAPAPASE